MFIFSYRYVPYINTIHMFPIQNVRYEENLSHERQYFITLLIPSKIFTLNKFNKFNKFAGRYSSFYFTNSKNLQFMHIHEILKNKNFYANRNNNLDRNSSRNL